MSLEQDVLDNNIKETEAIKDYAYITNKMIWLSYNGILYMDMTCT